MKRITNQEALQVFNSDGEVWVHSGDYGDMPCFEYELDEDGEPIEEEENRLMHPKSLDQGDTLEDLMIYNNFYVSE